MWGPNSEGQKSDVCDNVKRKFNFRHGKNNLTSLAYNSLIKKMMLLLVLSGHFVISFQASVTMGKKNVKSINELD